MGASQSRHTDQPSNNRSDNTTTASTESDASLKDFLNRTRATAHSNLDQVLYGQPTAEPTNQNSHSSNDNDDSTTKSNDSEDSEAGLGQEQSWSNFFERFGAPAREEQAIMLAQAQVSHRQTRLIKERAIDNCADVHADLRECFRNGSWSDWLTMCEFRRSAFWNCVGRQETLLRELNYAARENSTPEEDLEIAMEADRLGRKQQAAEDSK
ncbi:hypothetical protein BDF19DRAFT_423487 [Syncephalis fuscata]|nr:hypothetical protein BDF19DRAFT_423487 [Syncephalis fuscata]